MANMDSTTTMTRNQPHTSSTIQPHAWTSSSLSQFDTLLFDCDGVLWHENQVIPGAIETLKELETQGKLLLFATNNSGKSRQTYVDKFKQLGFTIQITQEQIFTSSQAAPYYLAEKEPLFDKTTQKVFTVGESGIGTELRARGINCVEAMEKFGTKHLSKSELSTLQLDPTIGAVLVGIDEQFTYTKAAYATALLNQSKTDGAHKNDLSNRRCLFISTNQDSNLPTAGHYLPGAGSCVNMIATACNRQPKNIGKPESLMLELAMEQYGLKDKSRILMVGDRLDTDILFGLKGDVPTLFVHETGINTLHDIETSRIYPTFIAPDVTCVLKAHPAINNTRSSSPGPL